jgi:CRISPR-associated endonuclease/helicase Cas3
MITIHLEGQVEKLAPENPWGLDPPPLYHQYRTGQALQEPDIHLVVNSYNTGTGKTRAALLHLCTIDRQRQDVLFVAPTNALLSQHTEDIQAFVQEQELDFKVLPVTAEKVRQLGQQLVDQGHYERIRPGEVLDRLIRNYREFFPDEQRRQRLILVVNPDIFYYAFTFRYGTHDQRNLFQRFLTAFNYIIIDEFHYYDQKQLAFFLFFFTISKKMGYFDQAGRKICLLSATPNAHVIHYLNQIFGDKWADIRPDNEPADSQAYKSIPTLTPLTLTITQDDLLTWGQSHRSHLQEWIGTKQQDGVIISDALRRINQLYALLRTRLPADWLDRITGPEPESARQGATGKPLILATPTVDIGYNFRKQNKLRQNIDFLICEARFGDDLIQRLGRAGRVLGKTQPSIPSRAIALLPEAAVAALRPYDGQTLSRPTFKGIIQQHADLLPTKHDLTGYIRTWAVTELFYPIYRAHGMVLPAEQAELETLYEELRSLFDVRRDSFKSLSHYFRKYYFRQKWLQAANNTDTVPFNKATAEQVADWFKFVGEGEYTPQDLLPHLAHDSVLGYPPRQTELRRFVDSQFHLTESLFNFRDSFQGPTAVFADPDGLLSSEPINAYDLFHIVEAYQVDWFEKRSDFVALYGDTALTGDFYGRLDRHRDPLLTIQLHYTTDKTEAEFKEIWEGQPVALAGFNLVARERGGDPVQLDARIAESLQEQFLTVLLVDAKMKGWAIRALKNSPIYGRRLTIDFADRHRVEYTVYLGKAAWLAFPELQMAYKIRDRMKSEAIIL